MSPALPIPALFVITSSDVGGSENFVRQLATGLDKSFDPLVCSLRPIGQIGRAIEQAGVRVVTLDMAERARPLEMIRARAQLRRIAREHRSRVVQSMLYRANALVALSWGFSRSRPCLIGGQRSLGAFGGTGPELMVRATHSRFDRWIAVSEEVKSQMSTRPGFLDRVHVIENGVDAERFSPREATGLRTQLGVREGEVLIGAAGRLSPKKAFDSLIEAVARLAKAGLAVQLRIAGEGEERARLQAQIEQSALSGRARLLGVRSDMSDFYSALDIFVLCSIEEGSPNALLEAMASQTASVATRVGGVEEIVSSPRLASLVEPNDTGELTRAIRALAESSETRSTMASAARKHVVEHFSVAEMIEKHAALYREVAATKDP